MNYSLQNMLTSLVGSACYLIIYIVIKELWFYEVVGYEAFIRPMLISFVILITIGTIWLSQESKEKALGAVMLGTLTMLLEGLFIMVVIEFPDMSFSEFMAPAFITTLACIAGLLCIGLVSRIQKRELSQIFGEIFPAVVAGWIVGALYIF